MNSNDNSQVSVRINPVSQSLISFSYPEETIVNSSSNVSYKMPPYSRKIITQPNLQPQ
jgi:hypothetical protein